MKIKFLRAAGVSLIVAGVTLMVTGTLLAQEYKLAKSTGRLELKELNKVIVEGHNGNEIIFTSLDYAREKDPRATGLRVVNSMGLEDNTGIGLSVVDKGATVEVYQLKRMDGPRVKILVPSGVIVSYTHSSPHGSDISFKNVEGEIEVSTVHNGITLENVTGPMTLKTVHGKIEANFNAGIKSPVSLVSVHGLIDVTLPAAVKVNLAMDTGHGEIYADPAFKIAIEKKDDKWITYGSGKVSGKINGGGADVKLSSSHGNIYLRSK